MAPKAGINCVIGDSCANGAITPRTTMAETVPLVLRLTLTLNIVTIGDNVAIGRHWITICHCRHGLLNRHCRYFRHWCPSFWWRSWLLHRHLMLPLLPFKWHQRWWGVPLAPFMDAFAIGDNGSPFVPFSVAIGANGKMSNVLRHFIFRCIWV